MKTDRCHIEIRARKKGAYGLIRTSFRKNGKVAHKTMGTLSGLSLEQLQMLRDHLQGKSTSLSPVTTPVVTESKEYGASHALLELAREIGIDKLLYSRVSERWVQDCMALIVGRLIYAGSKLSLCNRWRDTVLWELCGVDGAVDAQEHCYEPMDRLLERQTAIERGLVRKHFKGQESLVLYDISGSFMEGEYRSSQLVLFGYNRDGKKGHAQIVFGLVCTEDGCPCAVEVFPGNTQDATTVEKKILQLKNKYGVKDIIFVGDRGMVKASNAEELKAIDGLKTISALTHREMAGLMDKGVLQMELFDEHSIKEVADPKNPGMRYCLCRNPQSAHREGQTRTELMDRTAKALNAITARKQRTSAERIGAQVGKILAKTKMGKLLSWGVKDGHLEWHWIEETISDEKALDGCYVIKTDLPSERMDKDKVVGTYKKLILVEKAFRNMKTASLEVRPVHHKLDRRICSHVLLCMLAYYLQWHMEQRLAPLFASDSGEKERFWTLENVIERLKSIRKQTVTINGVSYKTVSASDQQQAQILKLLKNNM